MSAHAATPAPRSTPSTKPKGDCRCACGNLLARLTPRGVEVKCRRCKRVVVLPISTGEDLGESVSPARAPPAVL